MVLFRLFWLCFLGGGVGGCVDKPLLSIGVKNQICIFSPPPPLPFSTPPPPLSKGIVGLCGGVVEVGLLCVVWGVVVGLF